MGQQSLRTPPSPAQEEPSSDWHGRPRGGVLEELAASLSPRKLPDSAARGAQRVLEEGGGQAKKGLAELHAEIASGLQEPRGWMRESQAAAGEREAATVVQRG